MNGVYSQPCPVFVTCDSDTVLVRDIANSPSVNHKGKEVNSDWFSDQWDERSVLGHARIHEGE